MTEHADSSRKEKMSSAGLFFFGIYLLIGSGFTIYNGKWFAGFPPQLDIAYILFGSSAIGAYIEATLAGILGFLCIWFSIAKKKKIGSDRQEIKPD